MSDPTSSIESLPPEMLQTIWRHLSLLDLIRCQQVCQKWTAYLPGNDQALHRALFSLGACQTTTGDIPSWKVYVNIRSYLEQSQDRILPRLKFALDIETSDWFRNDSEKDTSRMYHPILLSAANYATLIHPSFDAGPCHNKLEFYEIEDLNVLYCHPEKTDQRWEQMLACVPAVQNMKVEVWWRMNIEADTGSWNGGENNSFMLWTKNGVTVRDVVEAVREALCGTETAMASTWMDDIDGYRTTENWQRIGE